MEIVSYPTFSTRKFLSGCALASVAALVLSACGGGGGGGDSGAAVASNGPTTQQISGSVVDGPVEGAIVFLDLNNNQAYDNGEPVSPPTNAAGAFSLVMPRLTQAEAALAMLVTHVPATARDADDGGLDLRAAGRRGFTLMSPASAYVQVSAAGANTIGAPLLSPLTTLVAAEMALNGLSLADAKAAVRQQLSLQAKDPLTNFVATNDRELGNLARTIAIALGETGRSISDVARNEGGQSVREHVAATIRTLKTLLPSLLANVNRQSPTPIPVADVVEQLPAEALATAAATQSGTSQSFRRYVVLFKDSVGQPAAQAQEAMRGRGGEISFTYTSAVKGFAVTLPEPAAEAFLQAMERNPNVDHVEVDQPVELRQTTQANATWGLDRTDQRDLPLSGSYSYALNGSGVRAYVVDTGVLSTHTDFGGRVTSGYTAINDGNGTTDCNGHGTHVAGTIGSATWGVAKGVTLVPVRVLDCSGSGTLSGVVAGLDWIAANAPRPAVVNMSLGASASSTLDAAVANLVTKGITMVVAAGNDAADACNYSPAREPSAITVGATTSSDARSSYSNVGTCLDLFAPGSSIKSTWSSSTTATNTISGTSMASPHVAGLAALLLQGTPSASPSQVNDAVKASATAGKVTSAGSGSPNLLVFSGSDSTAVQPPPSTLTSASVSALTGASKQVRNGWRATVTVSVVDGNGQPVAGAVAAGSFSIGGTSVSCTTNTSGQCSFQSGQFSKWTSETMLSVTAITGTNLIYDSTKNVVVSVTVLRP